ncbi:unnamed protein product [Paramecium pentaurelia]|uniref:Uncharacterized protein n=1 Tax=Paramecium pentaurelia TaxID=43138 RepID=A0A8S1S711_9CILI|nr:unnamed protein product [Paramecium pentaurelia]
MNYHRNPSQNHHYKTLKKSNFYFQSLKTDTQIQNKQNEILTNLRTVIQQNEILLSEINENIPIVKKKVRSQKLSCECSIY